MKWENRHHVSGPTLGNQALPRRVAGTAAQPQQRQEPERASAGFMQPSKERLARRLRARVLTAQPTAQRKSRELRAATAGPPQDPPPPKSHLHPGKGSQLLVSVQPLDRTL